MTDDTREGQAVGKEATMPTLYLYDCPSCGVSQFSNDPDAALNCNVTICQTPMRRFLGERDGVPRWQQACEAAPAVPETKPTKLAVPIQPGEFTEEDGSRFAPECEHECGHENQHDLCHCVKCGTNYLNRDVAERKSEPSEPTIVRPEDSCNYWLHPERKPEESAEQFAWTIETMNIINKLTTDIKGKAFDPDWFLLRQRFEQFERKCKE